MKKQRSHFVLHAFEFWVVAVVDQAEGLTTTPIQISGALNSQRSEQLIPLNALSGDPLYCSTDS
jgi:hypothetical protein